MQVIHFPFSSSIAFNWHQGVHSLFSQFFSVAIMSLKNERSGGGAARAKELQELFGRSSIFLGFTEESSGFWAWSTKRKSSSAASRF
jgi:hypothetical protein